jgi:hypothetical protein
MTDIDKLARAILHGSGAVSVVNFMTASMRERGSVSISSAITAYANLLAVDESTDEMSNEAYAYCMGMLIQAGVDDLAGGEVVYTSEAYERLRREGHVARGFVA